MIFSFKDYAEVRASLKEADQKIAVITFGRFNPPTSGHVKVMESLSRIAKKYNGVPMVFLSHSQDAKKNPLSYQDKLKYVRLASPSGVRVVETQAKTIYDVVYFLSLTSVKKVVIIVGSDRVAEFERIEKYAEKYNMDEIRIVSAGNRGEGSLDNIENVSASALRKLAHDGKMKEFVRYSALSHIPNEAEEMYFKVRAGLGLTDN